MFFLDKGLVKSGLLHILSMPWVLLLLPLLLVLVNTIQVNSKLNRRLLH
jgi:hypothetical protein